MYHEIRIITTDSIGKAAEEKITVCFNVANSMPVRKFIAEIISNHPTFCMAHSVTTVTVKELK